MDAERVGARRQPRGRVSLHERPRAGPGHDAPVSTVRRARHLINSIPVGWNSRVPPLRPSLHGRVTPFTVRLKRQQYTRLTGPVLLVSLIMANTKPFVASACFCEHILVEKDEVTSAIRIVDTYFIPPLP